MEPLTKTVLTTFAGAMITVVASSCSFVAGSPPVAVAPPPPPPPANSVNTVENIDKAMRKATIPSQKVITDPFFDAKLEVLAVDVALTPGGLLKAQVSLRNNVTTVDDTLDFAYRFVWYDANGMETEISDESKWQEKRILPGDRVTISAIAPSKSCRDYLVRIKAIDKY